MRDLYWYARNLYTVVRDRIEAWYTYRFPHLSDTLCITDARLASIETRGLFSIFLEILDLIAANGDKEITVDLRKTPYNSSPKDNMWTQYFEPIDNSVRHTYALGFLPIRSYRYRKIKENLRALEVLHTVFTDRVRIRPELLAKVDAFRRERLLAHGVIGVHIRGTDYLHIYGDRIDVRKYFSEIDRLLASGYSRIFLATDDAHFHRAFIERYGDVVVTYAEHRTEGGRGLHFGSTSPKEIGEEVIMDWLLLGSTQYFLHGESNVATAVLIFNPRLPRKDILHLKELS